MHSSAPLFRIVLITFKRADLFERCLDSLLKALPLDSQATASLWIRINGLDVDSEKVFLEKKSLFEKRGVSLYFESASRAETPAGARNHLLKDLKEEWVFFIDDDAFVPIEYFKTFFKTLPLLSEHHVALGGPNITPPGSSFFSQCLGEALGSRFCSPSSSNRYFLNQKKVKATEKDLILCNLWVKSSVLNQIHFDATLDCAEENLLLDRIAKISDSFYAEPDLFVFHERKDDFLGLSRQVRKYAKGRVQIFFKSRSTFSFFPFLPLFLIILSLFLMQAHHLASLFCVVFLFYGCEWVYFWIKSPTSLRKPSLIVLITLCIHLSYSLSFVIQLFSFRNFLKR